MQMKTDKLETFWTRYFGQVKQNLNCSITTRQEKKVKFLKTAPC